MANNLIVRGKIQIDAGPAESALAAVGSRMERLASSANTTNRTLREQSTVLKNAAAAAKQESDALANMAKAQAQVTTAQARTAAVKSGAKNQTDVTAGRTALLDAQRLTQEAKTKATVEESAARQAAIQAREQRAQQAALRREQEAANAQLGQTRYALYDVSRTAAVLGTALLAIPVATAAVAIAWEKDFANVKRTVTDIDLGVLREQFVDLVQAIPEDWGALTEIGTLAGQLGIAGEDIVNFTKTVSMFSTTTGVNVDETATAFGRLNALIPDVKGNYLGLAESVLKVGVNSVATEAQILRISKELSFLGTQTSFSSTQIIGLSGAMASVGISPELSRGVIARAFGVIGRAASENGEKLLKIGKIAGMSGEEFKQAWSEDAGETFKKFMLGVADSGQGATEAIRALGIQGIRDVPALIRLANAADSTGKAGMLITQTFKDAANASGELTRQYDIQASTISAKIQLLVNNVQALMDAAGSGTLGPIGAVLDFFITKLQQLTDFAQTDVGAWIVGISLALTGLVGALGLAVAAVTAGIAGYAALILAMRGLSTAAGGSALSLGGMNAMLAATGPLGAKAATAIRAVGFAMKGLSLVGVALVLPDVAKWAGDTVYNLTRVDKSFDETLNRFTGSVAFKVQTDNDFLRWIREAGESIGYFAYDGQRDLDKLDQAFSTLAEGGNVKLLKEQFSEFLDATDYSLDRAMKELPGFSTALEEAGIKVKQLKDGTLEFSGAAGSTATATGELTEEENELAEAHKNLTEVFSAGSGTFLDIQGTWASMIEGNKKLAQETADGTADMSDSWETYFSDYSVNLDEYLANLEKQVIAQNNWETNMFKLKESGASDAVIEELMRLGVEGAPLVEKFVNGTAEQLDQFDRVLQEKSPELLDAITSNLEGATPAFWAAARAAGDGAAAEILAGLANGTLTINQAIQDYNLDLPVDVNTDPATEGLNIWLQSPDFTAPKILTVDADPMPAKLKVTDVKTGIEALLPILKFDGDNKDANKKVQDTKDKAASGASIPVTATTGTASGQIQSFRNTEQSKAITIPVYTKVMDSLQAIRDSVKPTGHDGGYFPGYRKGGFTGAGGEWQEAGTVHRGEFVMTKRATERIGVANLYSQMRVAERGFNSGGAVAPVRQATSSAAYGKPSSSSSGGTVFATMDAQSIQALASAIAASPTFLYTTDRLIAESASRGSQGQTVIGSN